MKSHNRRKPNDYRFFEKYSWYMPGVSGMFMLLLWILVGAVIGNVATLVLTAAAGQGAAASYGTLIAYPLMFIPAMLYASVKSRNASMDREGVKLDSNNFSPVGGVMCAVLAVLATLAAAFCSDALSGILPPTPEWFEQLMEQTTQGIFWVNFISVSIFAPLFEEWLCRGMVLRGLLHKGMRPVWSIIVSALFFAFIHLNPWQALPAFLLGCLFGYVYYKTGSLKLTMLMHLANNTFALVISNIDSLKDYDGWRELFPGYEYWIIFAACLLLTVLAIKAFARIKTGSPKGGSDTVPSIFGSGE